jgi:Tfp pilus assembly protein PilP
MYRAAAVAALVLLVSTVASGQSAAGSSAPQAPASASQATTSTSQAASGPATASVQSTATYTYQPEGRRDPFVSLLGTGPEPAASRKGEGAGGLALNDISVRGVVESGGTLVAVVQGSDNRTYLVHRGDKFLDGTVEAINRQGLIVIQDVNDPLSLVKQREIRKLLRSLEDANK